MPNPIVLTQRLEIRAATPEMARAELADRSQLALLLGACVPEDWPPEFNDEETMRFMLARAEESPGNVGWWYWYIVRRAAESADRVLIGGIGFKGQPADDGVVEIGYSLLRGYQQMGYGTEAIRGMVGWAMSHAGVCCVIAETFPELTGSIRVLERTGFHKTGPALEPGAIRFELPRARWQALVPDGLQ